MARVLVSILSENLIANFLFYKEKQAEFDAQIFITTPQMKNKGAGIKLENAMGLEPNSIRRIEVPNDNYSEIVEKLCSEQLSKDDEYWINQTGGTKVMAIAVYSFFKDYNSHYVYLAIGGKAFLDMNDSNVSYPITYNATLTEYLALYGIRYESSQLKKDEQFTYELFDKMKHRKWWLPKNMLQADLYYENAEDKVYYKGAWFEEFSYLLIKKVYGLEDKHIALSAKLYRKDSLMNDNEIDVMYIKENKLHIVECKVGMNGYGDPKDTVVEYLYKLAAIAKDLGLIVDASIYTLHNMSKFSENECRGFEKRMKILGISGIYDGPQLYNLLNAVPAKETISKNIKPIVSTNAKSDNKVDNCYKDAEFIDTERPQIGLKVVGKIDLSKIK